MFPVNCYKNIGATNDLKDVIECAVSASCGKWFHIEIELDTKDDLQLCFQNT